MKAEIRDLLADIRAALLIGHPGSLDAALDGWRGWSRIASNQGLSAGQVAQYILPVGEVLAGPRVPDGYLERLGRDSLVALRAAAGVALLRRGASSGSFGAELARLAGDPRQEVRRAIAMALAEEPLDGPVWILLHQWLTASSTRVRITALWSIIELVGHGGISPAEATNLSQVLATGQMETETPDLRRVSRQAEQALASLVADSSDAD